jgi:hypothetical protein
MSPITLAPSTIDAPAAGGASVDTVILRKRAMEILASLKRDQAEATRTASESRRGDALAKATGRSVFDRAIAEVERTLDVLDRHSGVPAIDSGSPLSDRVR